MEFGRKGLTAAQQFAHLRANRVYGGQGSLSQGRIVWRYTDAPTPLSRRYGIRLNYENGGLVEVFVDDPDLSLLADGRDLPHVYAQRPARLCLYLPRTREWTPERRVDQTIMPWTTLWLFYFEDWLLTNEWKGGGEHPDPDAPASGRERRQLEKWSRRRAHRDLASSA